jgi:hypothetical protein
MKASETCVANTCTSLGANAELAEVGLRLED